jgi:hypothetical protein
MVFGASGAKSQNWMKIPEIGSIFVYSIIEHNGALYAVTPAQIYESTNAGDTWQPTAGQPNLTGELSRLFSNRAFIYAGTISDGVFRSGDGGQSWQGLRAGLPSGPITGFAVLGDSLYVGTDGNGVYVLNLQNPSGWSVFNNGLSHFGVISMGTSGNNLVAGIALSFYVRPHGSAQWTEISLDSSQRAVYETMPLGQHLFAGTNRGVYRSALDAQNWQKSDITAFPDRNIVALTIHQSRLFAGLRFGAEHFIFSTDDAGTTWEIRAHEFADLFDLVVSGDRMWAGRADGLWYFDLEVGTSVERPGESGIPSRFHLRQNYPNPFNPSTSISFIIPKAAHVGLKIYNIGGNEILTLLDEFRDAGSHTINFDAGTLPSGVYIYKMQAGEYEAAKKMILTK